MKIPRRQNEIDALTRKYLTSPNTSEAEDGRRQHAGSVETPDAEIIELCRRAKNAAKFAALFDAGDTAAHNNNDSEADLALLGILKFYTQDFGQLERLFTASALGKRSKWRNRDDYRRRTIDKALSGVVDTYSKPGVGIHSRSLSNEENGSPKQDAAVSRTQPLTAAELMAMTFEPTRWVVPGVLPEGLSLLVGKPKKGKSWMALGMCEAVAGGGVAFGTRRVEQGDTLYLALEDNHKRLQKRLRKVLNGAPPPAKMHVEVEWDRLDEGGAERLDEWLTDHPGARLVVIDTLAKIRQPARGNNIYAEDYAALEKLLTLAAKHRVAIVVVHHLRKMAASDPMDEISSSTGLTAGVDGFMILRRTPGSKGPTLFVDGRDIEEPTEYALHWNHNTATWTIEGDAEEVRISQERGDILLILNRAPSPLTPKEVSDVTPGTSYGSVKKLMWTMLGDGQLLKDDKGRYSPTTPTNPTTPGNPGNSGNPGNPGNSGNPARGDADRVTGLPGDDSGGNLTFPDTYAENDASVTGVTEVTEVGQCRHGTPGGYPCDDCETDDRFGGTK
jgi:hypothetical protein